MNTISNIIHILAAIVWFGGMFFIKFVLQPAMKEIDAQQSAKLMGSLMKRFTITAWTCVVLLIITGFMKTPTGMLFDTASHFGLHLMIKHILILLAIIVGLMIAFYVGPKIRKNVPKAGEAPNIEFLSSQKKLSILTNINLVLGFLIIVLAKLLW